MKVEKMVEEIDNACGNTLNITHYLNWELHSYGEGSLFQITEVESKSFKALIEKVYKLMKEREKGEL